MTDTPKQTQMIDNNQSVIRTSFVLEFTVHKSPHEWKIWGAFQSQREARETMKEVGSQPHIKRIRVNKITTTQIIEITKMEAANG